MTHSVRLLSLAFLTLSLTSADAGLVDFDDFAYGTVNGQGGWTVQDSFGSSTFSVDQEIVDFGGGKAWRISNSSGSTTYSDQPYSHTSSQIAGEPGSSLVPSTPADATSNIFNSSFDFMSATGAFQDGLSVAVSASGKQSSNRMSYIRIFDDSVNGLSLEFYDTDSAGGFDLTTLATGLSYDELHNVSMNITFNDGLGGSGEGNDLLEIYLNGSLIHTGTTWETYYANLGSPREQAVDSLLFRVNPSVPSVNGGGLIIDNVDINNGPVVPEPSSFILGALLAITLVVVRFRSVGFSS